MYVYGLLIYNTYKFIQYKKSFFQQHKKRTYSNRKMDAHKSHSLIKLNSKGGGKKL